MAFFDALSGSPAALFHGVLDVLLWALKYELVVHLHDHLETKVCKILVLSCEDLQQVTVVK